MCCSRCSLSPVLILIKRPDRDGVYLVAVQNLLRLAEFTTNERYREMAQRALRVFAGQLTQAPMSMPRLLAALDFSLDKPKEIVIVTPAAETPAEAFLARLRTAFVPHKILVVTSQGSALERQQQTIPLLQFKIAIDGKTTAYVCEQQICAFPTVEAAVFGQQITTVEPLPESP